LNVSVQEAPAESRAEAGRARDFLALTKPRITLLVVLSTLVGFLLGAPSPADPALLAGVLLGTGLVSGAASALNQWAERTEDGLMRRTAGRPLPSGRLGAPQAAWFGVAMALAGCAWLFVLVNPLSSLLAGITAASYLLLYTPLKKRSSLSTVVGAVPGAIPPMIGWAGATGGLSLEAWVLFGIVFFWQMPHFLAIAVLFRQDYARAGFRVLPVLDPDGASTGRHASLYSLALIPVSLLPAVTGLAGPVYFAGALLLGGGMLALSLRLAALPSDIARARSLFRFSLIYLPLAWLLLTVG
jgi:protoheme IX farnesyltransferase